MLDRLDEVGHRDARDDERRRRRHRLLDGRRSRGPCASSSSPVFTRRSSLTSASRSAAGRRRRSGPGSSVVSAHTRSPIATVPAPATAAGDALEDRLAVVGLLDDDQLALRLLAHVEGGEHPRHHEDRLGARAEERAGHPPVGIRRLAEARHLPLDARSGTRDRPTARGTAPSIALGLEPLARRGGGARRSRTSARV